MKSLFGNLSKMNSQKNPFMDARGYIRALPDTLLLLAFISSVTFISQGPLLMYIQLYLADRGATSFLISLSISLSGLGILLGGSLWGVLSSRFSRRALLASSLVSDGLFLAALTLPIPVGFMLGVVFLRSLAISALIPLSTTAASEASTPERRGRILAFMTSSRALGWIIGSSIGGFILDMLGFRGALLTMSALPIASAFLATAIRKANSPTDEHTDKTLASRALAQETSAKDLIYPIRGVYFATILRQIAITGAVSLVYVYFSSLGLGAASMGLAQALNPAIQLVTLPLAGRIADRIGRRPVCKLGFFLSALIPLAFMLRAGIVAFALGWLLVGLSFSLIYVGVTAHIGDKITRNHQGLAFGVFESSRGFGTILGPLLAGVLARSIGMQLMLLVMFGIALLGYFMCSFRAFSE